MPDRRELIRADSRSAVRIAGVYAVIAAVWIVLSDRVLEALGTAATSEQSAWLKTARGVVFILVTTLVVWGLVLRRLRQIRRAEVERAAVEGRLETFADNLPGVAYIKDADEKFVFIRGRMP